MNGNEWEDHSAASSALGYLYQVRYALLETLRRMRKGADFSLSIETLDDVVFESIGNPHIFHAVRNFFRAFEQRSRWVREDLLHVGELDRYEDRLVEEWDVCFQQMREDFGDDAASEEEMQAAAQALYKWVETATHVPIRAGVNEPSISRGTYQTLSDAQRVGWHVLFNYRLRKLLQPSEVGP